MEMELRSDSEFDEGKAALAQFIGDVEAGKLSWLSRLVRREDGFKLRVESATTDLRSRMIVDTFGPSWYASPWLADQQYLAVRTLELPIAEGVALLQSDRSPEVEIHRRAELTRRHEERRRQEKLDAAAREKAQEEVRARERALDVEYKAEKWWALTPLQQCLILLALAVGDGKTGSALESELRSLASMAGKTFPAPRRRWWEVAQ